MTVIIDEVVSNVRALSRDSVLAPETLRALVAAVLDAVERQREHEARRAAELDPAGAPRRRRQP